jgi:type IV pilus assembly protein PilN
MILINLLPVRQMKKRARARNEVVFFCGSFFALLALLGIFFFGLNQKVSSMQENIQKLKQTKASYNKYLNEIKKLDRDKALLNAKIDAIKKLKTKSQISVRLLDAIASATPQTSIWLNALKQSGSSVSLTGIALDNTRIAEYMNTLTASPYFSSATLVKSALTQVAGRKLKSFSLILAVDQSAAVKKESDPGKKK